MLYRLYLCNEMQHRTKLHLSHLDLDWKYSDSIVFSALHGVVMYSNKGFSNDVGQQFTKANQFI